MFHLRIDFAIDSVETRNSYGCHTYNEYCIIYSLSSLNLLFEYGNTFKINLFFVTMEWSSTNNLMVKIRFSKCSEIFFHTFLQ